jgi:hypothetical protein
MLRRRVVPVLLLLVLAPSCSSGDGDGDEAATSTTTTTTTAAASAATPLEGRWTTRFTDPNGLPPGTWVLRVHGTSAELTNPRQPSAPFDLGSPLVVEGGTVTDRSATLTTQPWARSR